MLDKIVSIQPKDTASGSRTGETREKLVQNLSKDMLNKVPMNFVQHEIREKFKAMGVLNPMVIFLRQEIFRIDRVIRIVRNSLTDLQLAIDGIIILNEVSISFDDFHESINEFFVLISHFDKFWIRFMMDEFPAIGFDTRGQAVLLDFGFLN